MLTTDTKEKYVEKLEECSSGAVDRILCEGGHPDQRLPADFGPLDTACVLAGQIYTVGGHVHESPGAYTTLLEWTKLHSQAPQGCVVMCQPNDATLPHMDEFSSETFTCRGIRGYIVDGGCLDSSFICRLGLQVWCRYLAPRDVLGRWVADSFGEAIEIGGVSIRTGDYVIAERDGVVIIPQEMIEDVVEQVEVVRHSEKKV